MPAELTCRPSGVRGPYRHFFHGTDRGLSLVSAPGGTSTNAVGVVGKGAKAQLLYSPGRIDPGNGAWTSSRKPLAVQFRYRKQNLFVIANHWMSKLGDDDLFGYDQPPKQPSETQRIAPRTRWSTSTASTPTRPPTTTRRSSRCSGRGDGMPAAPTPL